MRLVVSYHRAIGPRKDGTWPDGLQAEDGEIHCSVKESINLVHPNDSREQLSKDWIAFSRSTAWNAFRELGEMFRGNKNFFWTKYLEE